jgi:predicted RNase H-like nuclease
MKYIGVDGCKGGWFAVEIDEGGDWRIALYPSISDLWRSTSSAKLILIDIPIGLGSSTARRCDLEARKVLGARGCCVFPAPCRGVLKAKSYEDACSISRRLIDKAISRQAWSILKKIQEVDIFLGGTKAARGVIRESHPEICFWALAGGKAMALGKKKPEGHKDRLELLVKLYPATREILEAALRTYQRKDVARDDILDAVVLALTASSPALATLPEQPDHDDNGLPMEIIYRHS